MPTLAAALLLAAAHAGPFTHKTSMEEWPERRVTRDFVLPKGWLQVELLGEHKSSTGTRNGKGEVVDYAGDTTWRYSRLWVNLDQGFSRRVRLYAHVPFVRAALATGRGAEVSTLALGDVHSGFWLQPWIGRAWATALQLDLKAPSGVEWPGDFIGGPANTTSFLTGTGITNLGAHLHGRIGIGQWGALRAQAGYVRKFPAVVGYVVETDGFGNGWLNPGDEFRLRAEAEVQVIDSIAVQVDATRSQRGKYQVGVSGPGTGRPDLDVIPGSAGSFVDAGAQLVAEPSPHLAITARASSQVAGDDTRPFSQLGLEFSPQPGLTSSLSVAVRW